MLFRYLNAALIGTAGLAFILFPIMPFNQENMEVSQVRASGANQVSYRINGELLGNDSVTADFASEADRFYLMIALDAESHARLTFVVEGEDISPGVFVMDDPSKRYINFNHDSFDCSFTSDEYYSGTLVIDHHEPMTGLLSGSFEFIGYSEECRELIRVTEGRFDVAYRKHM